MKILFVFRGGEWIGIEYLSAYLKTHGHKVELAYHPGSAEVERRLKSAELFHRVVGTEKKMLKFAEKFEPDIIAFSSPTNLFPWVKKMATLFKQHLGVPMIIGGPHATSIPEYVLLHSDIDMVCVGEGEDAFLELVNSMEKGENRTDIDNIWFKRDGKIIKNKVRPLITDLDSLPFPDKELFDKYGAINDRLYIMTARGCPFNCSYCYTSMLKSIYNGAPLYRRRSVKNVMEEIEYHLKRRNYKEIYFYDDIFTLNKEWLSEFAEVYPREIGIPFKALVHPEVIDKESVSLLRKAGCYYVDIGIEAGSEKMRKNVLHRNISDRSIVEAVEMLKNGGIKVCTLNMFGIPEEREEEMWKTVEFNLRLKPDGAITSIMYPFPNTGIYHYCRNKGYLSDETQQKIMEGYGSYKETSFVANSISPSKVYRYMRVLPLLVKLKVPPFIGKILLKIPIPRFLDVTFIPFTSIFPNFWYRFKEFVGANLKTFLYYRRRK